MSAHQPAGEMPEITSSLYGSVTSTLPLQWTGMIEPAICDDTVEDTVESTGGIIMPAELRSLGRHQALYQHSHQPPPPTSMPTTARRLVQVFIADTDANVPLDNAMLYRGEPVFTDSTDQELYFDIPVAALLKEHNAKRITWPDKEASRKAGKDIVLEPAKIRDLKMVVVTIAQF